MNKEELMSYCVGLYIAGVSVCVYDFNKVMFSYV